MDTQARWLKAAFLAGAITDALALGPMLVPPLAHLLWGFDAQGGEYRFAMGYGATLMAGWTGASRVGVSEPVRAAVRRGAYGVRNLWPRVTEIVAVASGHMAAWRMIPTWILQAVLLAMFAGAYHYPRLRRVGLVHGG
jgi:hypothetical protein